MRIISVLPEQGRAEQGRAEQGRAGPRALGAKPEDGGFEAVHGATPGCVAGNVDKLGVHGQLQHEGQQLEPGSCPPCTQAGAFTT